VIILAIGIGAAITPLQGVSGPLVCGEDHLELQEDYYSYKPGQSGYTITWYCVNEKTGAKQDRTLPVILASGVIYSLVLFVITVGLIGWGAIRQGQEKK
jgi:hypothetical protein